MSSLFKKKFNNKASSYLSKKNTKYSSISSNNIVTSSFDKTIGSPLYSTSQLNIDFSKFENHTFFHSAIVKTNEIFEKITNRFPIGASDQITADFYDGLTGFDKYVFHNLQLTREGLGEGKREGIFHEDVNVCFL